MGYSLSFSVTNEQARRLNAGKILTVRLVSREKCSDGTRKLLAAVLNEFLRTMFPETYRCVAVCPVLLSPVEKAQVNESYEGCVETLYPYIVDSPAAQNIIKTVKESDEIIYVLSTGPCTSVVSAYMMDPSIADNMCVLWLGCQCLDIPNGLVEECNLNSDFLAGQLLLDLDIPLVLLPCQYNGSIKVVMNYNDFMNIDGNSKGAELFREGYPLKYVKRENFPKYTKVMCDLVAPASIALNDSMTYSIVTAPGLTDDLHYIFDESRRKIVYMENPDSKRIIEDAIKSINKITKGN